MLGPEAAAYVLRARNGPGVVARALSRNVIKAVQWPAPIPFWVAQRCEDIITGLPPFPVVPHAIPCVTFCQHRLCTYADFVKNEA